MSLNIMKVINPENSSHLIGIIPRYYGFSGDVLTLINEVTKVETIVAHTSSIVAGVAEILFDFDFNEGDRYELKLSDDDEILFRGMLFATSQDVQQFDNSVNYYSYE